MRIFVRNSLLCFLILACSGSQWYLLQTVAWTTMFAGNLHTQSLAAAVSQTFDGRHPCPLCKAIEAGKKSEKSSDTKAPVTKIEFLPSLAFVELAPPAAPNVCFQSENSSALAAAEPPSPPPRSIQA
jgi:hypothetical protein